MTTTVNERSGWPGSVEDDQRPEPAGFLLSYPGYRSTAPLDRLRATEYSYLDAGGHTYLDYTGAGLPAQAQLNAHTERLRGRCFGNPHSENPTSAASTELIERLIARREALGRLRRPWFAGGSVHMVTVQGDWHTPAADEACFEDSTLSFLQIPDLESGLSWINGIGMDLIHQRVTCLTGWFIDRLAALRHGNGEPMARIYGPANTRARGGTIAFNLLDPGGRVVDERAVARATAAAGISIRTGCFCNPGAGEGAFGLTQADWRRAARGQARTLDQYLDLLGLPSGGALRASVGLASNVDDVERFIAFVELTYTDRVVGTAGLVPRQGC
jgi:selenocysteine lyase/cysteine desulfurase